jgi:hypothetical protein
MYVHLTLAELRQKSLPKVAFWYTLTPTVSLSFRKIRDLSQKGENNIQCHPITSKKVQHHYPKDGKLELTREPTERFTLIISIRKHTGRYQHCPVRRIHCCRRLDIRWPALQLARLLVALIHISSETTNEEMLVLLVAVI